MQSLVATGSIHYTRVQCELQANVKVLPFKVGDNPPPHSEMKIAKIRNWGNTA